MLFNSYTFIVFFLVVLLLHHLPLAWRVKKFNLLIASYVFYAAWNPPFVTLLWISTIVDWFIGKWIFVVEGKRRRFVLVLVSLGANLGLLGFFKYGGFILENFIWLMNHLGIEFHPARPDIILPVGISFYTFQTLSYTLDIYRGKTQPCRSFLDYALYVTFFPQWVAGPIVRSTVFLPQCITPQRATATQMSWGLSLFVLGLFEKVVVADGFLAPVVERVYDSLESPDFISAWTSTAAFAGQIFCDFAGYSTCAIGVAMCLGFVVKDNFRFPYAATGFSDFWRRWHISLSTWLRDYLYIPLGGNRKQHWRTYANLMLTMLIGGLWHGASWTFVVWGGLHGVYLAIERAVADRWPVSILYRQRLLQPVLATATFLLVCLTWVFFRAGSFTQAISFTAAMLGLTSSPGVRVIWNSDLFLTVVVMTSICSIHWVLRDTTLEVVSSRVPWWIHSMLLAMMLIAIATTSGVDRAFIYFQF
jgi:alginate O-acetyltransferase complex protein AlgI